MPGFCFKFLSLLATCFLPSACGSCLIGTRSGASTVPIAGADFRNAAEFAIGVETAHDLSLSRSSDSQSMRSSQLRDASQQVMHKTKTAFGSKRKLTF
jgi:hypothetical protein